MTKRPSWRYKCDFCGKTGASGGHMAKHEKRCTANPNRECRMCKLMGVKQCPMSELQLIIQSRAGVKYEGALDALTEAAEGCPVCILAAIRQSRVNHHDAVDDEGFPTASIEFDYRSAMKSAMDDVNEASQEREQYQ